MNFHLLLNTKWCAGYFRNNVGITFAKSPKFNFQWLQKINVLCVYHQTICRCCCVSNPEDSSQVNSIFHVIAVKWDMVNKKITFEYMHLIWISQLSQSIKKKEAWPRARRTNIMFCVTHYRIRCNEAGLCIWNLNQITLTNTSNQCKLIILKPKMCFHSLSSFCLVTSVAGW